MSHKPKYGNLILTGFAEYLQSMWKYDILACKTSGVVCPSFVPAITSSGEFEAKTTHASRISLK
ncbi:hypothetical protein ABNC42_14970 [Paenibacillus larvae]